MDTILTTGAPKTDCKSNSSYLSTGWVTFDDVTLGSSAAMRKYYYAGGQLAAMRDNGVVRFPRAAPPQRSAGGRGDHLGSTSVTADSTGAEVGELRYREASRRDKPCPLRGAPLRSARVRIVTAAAPHLAKHPRSAA